jgi:N-acetylglucosamine malate deacetylase 1
MESPYVVLVVAAHPDDDVLGCGGTMAKLSAAGHAVHVLTMADGVSARAVAPGAAAPELLAVRNAAASKAASILGCASMETRPLPDNRLDGVDLLDVVKLIEEHIDRLKPHVVFTHHTGDLNVDHQIVHEAVLVACRPVPGQSVKNLYFFEVPSATEWRVSGAPFQPNHFVDISATLAQKRDALAAYDDEMRPFPHARSIRAVEALAVWRGATVGVNAAEAFMVGRQIR